VPRNLVIDQIGTDPAAPTSATPVTITFQVTCRRTGSGSNPVTVVAEIRVMVLLLAPRAVTCAVADRPMRSGCSLERDA